VAVVVSREVAVLRDVCRVFLEPVMVREVFVKVPARVFVDLAKVVDPLAKVAYKIYGLDVRRVYALPRALADVISPEDQNVRVAVCEAMLEAVKKLKEKLGA